MAREEPDAQKKPPVSAREVLDEAWDHAQKAYKEAKKQAGIVHEEAKKLAVDKQAKKEADEAYKEAVKQAKRDSDAITGEAQRAFSINYEQSLKDRQDTITKSKERTDRATKAYNEAKKQADIVHREAKEQAVDKQTKKEASEAHKEAVKQADKDYHETITQ